MLGSDEDSSNPAMLPKAAKIAPRGWQQKRDEDVMNTNNSSIASKCSVSDLYLQNEPNFYIPFVGKNIRRHPLINRGYYLRMVAIETVVQDFLKEHQSERTLIVNLGAGDDPLPFRLLHNLPHLCQQTTFVDVDYPELMQRKRRYILTNSLLTQHLTGVETEKLDEGTHIRSDQYVAMGCDLSKDLAQLKERVLKACPTEETLVLCVAEVSIAYMSVSHADAVIKMASTFPNARFCLLEQFLPDGADHPFARTMLSHFDKLQTTLKVIHRYPQLQDQVKRFHDCGFAKVSAYTLWDIWQDSHYMSVADRKRTDALEPFDEWEEFVLFAGHYFLLVADKSARSSKLDGRPTALLQCAEQVMKPRWNLQIDSSVPCVPRRFGTAFVSSNEEIIHHAGVGTQSRLASANAYHSACNYGDACPGGETMQIDGERVCHTSTIYDKDQVFLVGGRRSPSYAAESCVTWGRRNERVQDLKPGRYRHCATAILDPLWGEQGVLVYGGKTGDGRVLEEWRMWTPQQGWQELSVTGCPRARFGATLALVGSAHKGSRGLLFGGLDHTGTIVEDCWLWHLESRESGILVVCEEVTKHFPPESNPSIYRFGATGVAIPEGLLLIGGVNAHGVLWRNEEIVLLRLGLDVSFENVKMITDSHERPLLIGTSAVVTPRGETLIIGGGAVCFSMGSFWNRRILKLHLTRIVDSDNPNKEQSTIKNGNSNATDRKDLGAGTSLRVLQPAGQVPRVSASTAQDFEKIMKRNLPVILTDLNIGTCSRLWTPQYLVEKVGSERQVTVHTQSSSDRLTFQTKNFAYVQTPFAKFIEDVQAGKPIYLRAVAVDKPFKQPTNLEKDFPTIAQDFQLPPELIYVVENMHSSPLRIAGPVTLWLHYDVLANVLCQIRGKKTLRLYPPTDFMKLRIPPGASSSDIDVFAPDEPALAETGPVEAVLKPGDVLFIPPLWCHAARPDEGMSVAVNVFFRKMESGYAAGRDVYGNRDLQAYEQGRRDIQKINKAFEDLPGDMARFYLERLAAELQEKAMDTASNT